MVDFTAPKVVKRYCKCSSLQKKDKSPAKIVSMKDLDSRE
jgi:hypothetical protein